MIIAFFIGLFIGAFFGFVACGFVVANSEAEKQGRKQTGNIDGLEATHGDEWNTEVEDIDE